MTTGSHPHVVQRYWSSRDAQLQLEAGYLLDPEADYAKYYAPSPVFTLGRLDDVPCVVLLGEPGSGKTTALRDDIARMSTDAASKSGEDSFCLIDLRDYADVPDLNRGVFEHPTVSTWKTSTSRLTLYLDSLDEALIEMRKLATRLATELSELPVERLRIRIACRTADWPSVLETELGRLWGDTGFQVLEIAPLRRRDVVTIASEQFGASRANAFLQAVTEQGAEPFAAKPGTLNFLLSSFAATGYLPNSQAELYLIGCRALCEETNKSRRAARRVGTLSADDRLAVASRVAAAMIFGGRGAVWMGLDRDAPPNDLRYVDLAGEELTANGPVRVTEQLLREDVISTGLFTARGPERLGWAHQTYAEFLAAWWISRRELTAEQVLALITSSDVLGAALVPQLVETIAWVASLRPDLVDAIMSIEPTVLLNSDVIRADEVMRQRLVRAMLDAAERNTLPGREFGQLHRYRCLDHDSLGEQLAPVIANRSRPDRVRELALEIAAVCETRETAPAAADLALDTSADIQLRASAAWVVASVNDETQAARLRSLALDAGEFDDSDQLKGSALRAAWRTFSPEELFDSLTRTKRRSFSGAYERFHSELAEAISDEHVVPGLMWIDRLGHMSTVGARQLEAAIVVRALGLVDDPAVLGPLVRRVRRCLQRYQPLLENGDERKALATRLAIPAVRRRLLEALLAGVAADADRIAESGQSAETRMKEFRQKGGRELYVHALSANGYLVPEDFEFVLDSLIRASSLPESALELAWKQIALDMLDVDRADHAIVVLDRSAVAPSVYEIFRHLIDPVELESPNAAAARQDAYEREQKRAKWAAPDEDRSHSKSVQQVDVPPEAPNERIKRALQSSLAPTSRDNVPHRWLRVFLELMRDATGEIPSFGSTGDVRVAMGWQGVPALVHAEIVDAAAAFLDSASGPTLDPNASVHSHRYAWAGYCAFRLLSAEKGDRLNELRADVWKRWAATIALAEPYKEDQHEQDAHANLARLARTAAQPQFDSAVQAAVEHALATEHWRLPAQIVSLFATAPLGDAILERCLEVLDRDLSEAARTANHVDSPHLSIEIPEPPTPDENISAARELRRRSRNLTLVYLLAALLKGGSTATNQALSKALADLGSTAPINLDTHDAERAFIAAESLLVGANDAGWEKISEAGAANPAFLKELFLRAARSREVPIDNVGERLGVRGVGEQFVALTTAFPYETDPHHDDVYSPGPRDNVTTWRRVLLETLENWGTDEAIEELKRVQEKLPQYDWLGFSVARARAQRGRATWRRVNPADLFSLAQDRARRLVRNEAELLDVVMQSLHRYQRELQGDIPAVVDLWDYSASTAPRPRDEGHFADHVFRFLRRDLEGRGIALGCELVVRRGGKGRAPGMRTDIYVFAVLAAVGAADRTDGALASIVIEAKGSWHKEVLSAMRTQLVEGYLHPRAGTRSGIYLVGDFSCDAWNDGELSRRSKELGGVGKLRRVLDVQASELSIGGVQVRAIVADASLPGSG